MDEVLTVHLGEHSPASRLVVGNATITPQGGTLPLADYERLKEQYDLREGPGAPQPPADVRQPRQLVTPQLPRSNSVRALEAQEWHV